MAKESLTSKKNTDIHIRALQRFSSAFSADEEQRKAGLEDIYFSSVEDRQWDDLAKERRKDRPRYTINKIAATIREIQGDYRQNRIELKMRPKNDAAKDLTDTVQGLVKSIVSTQSAELAKDNAFKYITTAGMGAWRITTKFNEDDAFDQDIEMDPIWEPLNAVWFDPDCKHPAGKGSRYCFIVRDFSREKFEGMYPNAVTSDFNTEDLAKLQRQWTNKQSNTVRVAEYFERNEITIDVVRLSDGRVITREDFEAAENEILSQGVTVVKSRKQKSFQVMRYKMNGSGMLEQPQLIPSKHIPVVRVLGYYQWIDNTLYWQGVVRNGRDAQRVYNYAVSANIEVTALAPKNKLGYTAAMVKGYEQEWKSMNTSNAPGLPLNFDPKMPGGPIPLSFTQSANSALVQQSQQAELDIQATMGRRAPAQGEAPSDRSGRAILALQRQSDQSTYELQSNMAQSVEYSGEIILDMMPRIYDAERQVRTLGIDDKEDIIFINQTAEENGKKTIVNDLSMSKFDVQTTVGPAYESKRVEAVNTLAALAENPQFGPLIPDLLAKSLDFPFADELEQRMRKGLLQAGAVTPTEEEQEAMNTPQAQEQAAIQMEIQKLQIRKEAAIVAQFEQQNANLAANTSKIVADTELKQQSAGKENAAIEQIRTKNYQTLMETIIAKGEAGLPLDPAEVFVMKQTLSLLSANIQEDETRLVQQNIQALQNNQ